MRRLLPLLLIILGGCFVPNQGSTSPEVRTELDILAEQAIPASEKYLQLGKVVSILLDETAAIAQNQAAAAHMERFLSDNESALRLLHIQLDNWEKNLTEEDRLLFMMELLAKPYSTKLASQSKALTNRFSEDEAQLAYLRLLTGILEFRR